MQVYLIKTENGHSHEWGGEFYYDEEEAHRRAAELYTMMEEEGQIIHFNVVKAEIIETTDREDNTIAISHEWSIEDVYEKAEEMDIEINNIQAGQVLDLVWKNIDSEYGISWDSIENAIETVMKENKIQNKIITNPDFWDCECKKNYIHRKNIRHCFKCGADRDSQPDSIQDEIDKYYNGDNDIDIKEH
jgi:hypothetical protein